MLEGPLRPFPGLHAHPPWHTCTLVWRLALSYGSCLTRRCRRGGAAKPGNWPKCDSCSWAPVDGVGKGRRLPLGSAKLLPCPVPLPSLLQVALEQWLANCSSANRGS